MAVPDTMTATLRYLTTDQGGRRRVMRNGGPSQLRVGGILTSCSVVATANDGEILDQDFLTPGREYRVLLVMFDPVHYQPEMSDLQSIELYEGSRLVAVGTRMPGDTMIPAPPSAVALLRRHA